MLLLDVFKGTVLYATSFDGARGPAHLALTENWLAVHFRNRKQKRFEIAMLEFFDAGSGSPDAPFSSLDAPLPIVYNRTYVYSDAVTALAVTTTMQVGGDFFLRFFQITNDQTKKCAEHYAQNAVIGPALGCHLRYPQATS